VLRFRSDVPQTGRFDHASLVHRNRHRSCPHDRRSDLGPIADDLTCRWPAEHALGGAAKHALGGAAEHAGRRALCTADPGDAAGTALRASSGTADGTLRATGADAAASGLDRRDDGGRAGGYRSRHVAAPPRHAKPARAQSRQANGDRIAPRWPVERQRRRPNRRPLATGQRNPQARRAIQREHGRS